MAGEDGLAWMESRAVLGMRFGLDRMRRLLAVLGDPHVVCPAIHVVGTNGKTSTTLVAARALSVAGLRSGAYLSPHVTGWEERVQVAGAPVSRADLDGALRSVRAAGERLGLPPDDGVTQFEALTAAAFLLFADAGLHAMAIEAGLGGRHDATNVLPHRPVGSPRLRARPVVALTNVSLEHTALLGDTEVLIAAEKLAVAPDGFDRLVVGRLGAAARPAVAVEAERRRLRGWWLDRDVHVTAGASGICVRTPFGVHHDLLVSARGSFQDANVALGVVAAERLLDAALPTEELRAGLADVRVPGRLELVPGSPRIVLDGAHNPDGMRVLASELPALAGGGPIVAVVSLLDDKDLPAMLGPLAAAVSHVVATRSGHVRAVAPETIAADAAGRGTPAEVAHDPIGAVRRARERAGPAGLVVVCGSLYLVADVNAAWPSDIPRERDVRGLTETHAQAPPRTGEPATESNGL